MKITHLRILSYILIDITAMRDSSVIQLLPTIMIIIIIIIMITIITKISIINLIKAPSLLQFNLSLLFLEKYIVEPQC